MSGSSLEIYKWLIAAWFFPGEGDIFPEVLLEARNYSGLPDEKYVNKKSSVDREWPILSIHIHSLQLG